MGNSVVYNHFLLGYCPASATTHSKLSSVRIYRETSQDVSTSLIPLESAFGSQPTIIILCPISAIAANVF